MPPEVISELGRSMNKVTEKQRKQRSNTQQEFGGVQRTKKELIAFYSTVLQIHQSKQTLISLSLQKKHSKEVERVNIIIRMVMRW